MDKKLKSIISSTSDFYFFIFCIKYEQFKYVNFKKSIKFNQIFLHFYTDFFPKLRELLDVNYWPIIQVNFDILINVADKDPSG